MNLNFLITIIFLILLGSVLSYFSFKEILWFFKKEEQKEKFRIEIRRILIGKSYQIIFMKEENPMNKQHNPFKNKASIVLPGFFGAGERFFYWQVKCKDQYGHDKIIWAEIKQSLFSKPRYKFNPDIGNVG